MSPSYRGPRRRGCDEPRTISSACLAADRRGLLHRLSLSIAPTRTHDAQLSGMRQTLRSERSMVDERGAADPAQPAVVPPARPLALPDGPRRGDPRLDRRHPARWLHSFRVACLGSALVARRTRLLPAASLAPMGRMALPAESRIARCGSGPDPAITSADGLGRAPPDVPRPVLPRIPPQPSLVEQMRP